MKLEVGMYIRFKDKRGNQYIRKITSINTEEPDKRYAGIYIDKEANNVAGVSLKNIVKASHNIIDLIEIGDYVNGLLVDKSRYGELYIGYVYCGGVIQRTTEAYATFISDMKNEDVETILTKEQFENNCYKIGDE